MASQYDGRIERLEQVVQERPVIWLRKIVHEGEEEESDRDCIVRNNLNPDDASVEYSFIVRRIVNHVRPVPERAEVEALLAEEAAAPEPVAPVAPAPKPRPAPPPAVDPFAEQLRISIEKIAKDRKGRKP